MFGGVRPDGLARRASGGFVSVTVRSCRDGSQCRTPFPAPASGPSSVAKVVPHGPFAARSAGCIIGFVVSLARLSQTGGVRSVRCGEGFETLSGRPGAGVRVR